jgi:pimeloyl-ACP methyl ester carboxylesterase
MPDTLVLREHTVAVWQDQVRMRVRAKGRGPALVFFHGPWGLVWDPFLDALARDFTVYAPEHPGTSPGRPDDIHRLDGLPDLVLCYEELLDGLELSRAAFVGHSFGAMVACEVAAAYRSRVSRLALVSPVGLWREDLPVVNWMLVNVADLPDRVFGDPASEAARRMFAPSEDPEVRGLARVQLFWAMGATGKFLWPLPDKGLKKRIHRVAAPTLLVWGADDRLVPPAYAEEFRARIAGARVEMIPGAGHAPHLEHPETVARVVGEFLGR